VPGHDLIPPRLDGAPEPADLERHLGIGEVADDLIDPRLSQRGVGAVVDLTDHFLGVRTIYEISDPDVAAEFVARLGVDLQDDSCPPEVRSRGRTIVRWRNQIIAWHRASMTTGPTEAVNNLVKRIKRIGFGFHRSAHCRIRVLLYADDRTGTYSPASHRTEFR
jgi:hypothetical protein